MRNFWCEIDIDALEHNIKRIREKTDKKIMAVVKARAYGLGIEGISKILDDMVDAFGVSNLEEALEVKSERDILILYPVIDENEIENIKDNHILTVDNEEILMKLNEDGRRFRVHVYVDTGMNRFGVKPEMLDEFIDKIEKEYKNIEIDGIYSHLHNTIDWEYTIKQINLFKSILEKYKGRYNNIHLLNTNGFLKYNDNIDFDNMIRVGNLIYGYNSRDFGYKRVFSYRAKAIRVYNIKKGQYIGYGNSFRAKRDMKVGILDVGFIDKFNCVLDIRKNVFFEIAKSIYHHIKYTSGITTNGRNVRIIGKTNMNFTIIDMEDFSEDNIFNIEMPSVIADSRIMKKYRKGDKYVSI